MASDRLDRAASLRRLDEGGDPWDLVVVGGGATGVGIAVDAASRGLRVALLERLDFAQGTSSRSTKLVHGGVRYLRQGELSLVRDALRERGRLARNAPGLVHPLRFVIPAYRWLERAYYGFGLRLYDALAGRLNLAPSRRLSKTDALDAIPGLRATGLRGGVEYHDAQFNDSRLLIHLARTAAAQGACLVNHAPVTGLLQDSQGQVQGVEFRDTESSDDAPRRVSARVVINATGAWCDSLRRLADHEARPLVAPSQGIHLVVDRRFLGGDTALMIPKTRDGRVVFAIPWLGRALIGTTDTPVDTAEVEPRPLEEEIELLLETAGGYLASPPRREDIRSVFAGIRPLVRPASGGSGRTASLSRDHHLQLEPSGLISITGGKWTTYRKMAEDAVDLAVRRIGDGPRPCVTAELRLWDERDGERRELIDAHPDWARPLDERGELTGADVVLAARHEMARRVEDVLARRTRVLLLDAAGAAALAPQVARLLAAELGRDESWERAEVEQFRRLAQQYQV